MGIWALATVHNVSVISEIREELIFSACKVFTFRSLREGYVIKDWVVKFEKFVFNI